MVRSARMAVSAGTLLHQVHHLEVHPQARKLAWFADTVELTTRMFISQGDRLKRCGMTYYIHSAALIESSVTHSLSLVAI